MYRRFVHLLAALLLLLGGEIGGADEKKTTVEVRESFTQFAAAVKGDKYDEAARWISPPADKVWTNFGLMRSAAAKYDTALEEKFGKSDEPPLLGKLGKKGSLAEHFYETEGEIQEVKEAGKDRAHVRVWTKRPDFQKRSEAVLYERTFTAVRLGNQWKFQLHSFGGTPVVKRVMRKTPDGKEVEVYAEHDPTKGGGEKNWVELKPISSDGREEDLKQEAARLVKLTELLKSQTELIQKGGYQTRKEALEGLEKAIPKR